MSFAFSDIHAHDIVTFADEDGVALRGGHHCNQPLMRKLGLTGTTRASFYVYNDEHDVDLLVEAGFEDQSLKTQVIAEGLPHLAPDALLASNTSTLPITGLGACVPDPGAFIGLHFFSPVDKMPLLEVIVTPRTAESATPSRCPIITGMRGTSAVRVARERSATSRIRASPT